MKFFRNKISVFTPKISEDLFLVIDHDFRIFPIFLKISHIFAASNVVYDPFFTRKTLISEDNSLMTPFFTLFMLSHASDKHYFSKYWGDGCMGRPPPQILGGPYPSPLRFPPVSIAMIILCVCWCLNCEDLLICEPSFADLMTTSYVVSVVYMQQDP